MSEKTRRLADIATVIRSKNAGPFELTFDVMFTDSDVYERVKKSGVFCPDLFIRLYGVKRSEVLSVHAFDPALSLKATVARRVSSGTIGDTDVFGAQQHAPLFDVEIPWD
jgi:hypothetical protein